MRMNVKTGVAVIVAASVLTSCNLWGPGVSEVLVCEKPNPKEGCEKSQDTFKPTTPKITATAKLDNVVEGTKVEVLWRLNKTKTAKDVKIYKKEFTTKLDQTQITTALAPAKAWQPGSYEVVFSIVGDDSKRESKKFEVK